MRADWTGSGACTSGSTAHPRGATRQASGCAATTSTTSAEPSHGCRWRNRGTGDLTTHGFRASFPASVSWRFGAALRCQHGGDDRLVRVHVGDGRDADARRLRSSLRARSHASRDATFGISTSLSLFVLVHVSVLVPVHVSRCRSSGWRPTNPVCSLSGATGAGGPREECQFRKGSEPKGRWFISEHRLNHVSSRGYWWGRDMV